MCVESDSFDVCKADTLLYYFIMASVHLFVLI